MLEWNNTECPYGPAVTGCRSSEYTIKLLPTAANTAGSFPKIEECSFLPSSARWFAQFVWKVVCRLVPSPDEHIDNCRTRKYDFAHFTEEQLGDAILATVRAVSSIEILGQPTDQAGNSEELLWDCVSWMWRAFVGSDVKAIPTEGAAYFQWNGFVMKTDRIGQQDGVAPADLHLKLSRASNEAFWKMAHKFAPVEATYVYAFGNKTNNIIHNDLMFPERALASAGLVDFMGDIERVFAEETERAKTRARELEQYVDCLLYTSPSPRDRG